MTIQTSLNLTFGANNSEWLFVGGFDSDQKYYPAPDNASMWGTQGCPLLPKPLRIQHQNQPLPDEFIQIFGERVEFDDLDSEFLELLGISKLSLEATKLFHNLINNIGFASNLVVIPTGIPLIWFEALPLTKRTFNFIRRAYRESGSDSTLDSPMLLDEFMEFQSSEQINVNEILCVTESMQTYVDIHGSSDFTYKHKSEELDNINNLVLHFLDFISWAAHEENASTVGEAFTLFQNKNSISKPWTRFASTKISKVTNPVAHPYEVLEKWRMSLNELNRFIYDYRISRFKQQKTSIQLLTKELDISGETLRLAEKRTHSLLELFLSSDDGKIVCWRADSIRNLLGLASPVSAVESTLSALPNCQDHRKVILDKAGPYLQLDGWYVLKSEMAKDPTLSILKETKKMGEFDWQLATQKLTKWGLHEVNHAKWLTRCREFEVINGRLEYVGTSVADRLYVELNNKKGSATINELANRLQKRVKDSTIKQVLSSDRRFVRNDKNRWGLLIWNLSEYSSVVCLIRNFLKQRSHPVLLSDIEDELLNTFGVRKSSTKLNCRKAPVFIVEGDFVRLRSDCDSPFRLRIQSIVNECGVFHLGNNKVGYLLQIDRQILNGSGTRLPQSAGAILNIRVNSQNVFSDEYGNKIVIRFPETSISGPSLSSLQKIVVWLSAQVGDYLCIVFDSSNYSMVVTLTERNRLASSWQMVSRLTGIQNLESLDDLARTVHCDISEVRYRLKCRGDNQVLDCIPTSKTPLDVKLALEELRKVIERGTY